MSPVAEGEARCFAVRRGELQHRLDPHFHLPAFRTLLAAIKAKPHDAVGALVEQATEKWDRADGRYPTEFPYIEISGVALGTDEYDVDMLATSEAPSRAQMVVRANDIILSCTRPHRGAVARIAPQHDGYIASTGFVILRRMRKPSVGRAFLYWVLSSTVALRQFLQRSGGGNYPAITSDEVDKVLIPVPPRDVQQSLVADMEVARDARRRKLEQADALLSGIDKYLLSQLGLTRPADEESRVFAARLRQARAEARLNPDYFHPQRQQAIRAIKRREEAVAAKRLIDIADFVRDRETAIPSEEYIGLASVQRDTGELAHFRDEEAEGQCFRFRTGDILFCRLRPYLNKVHRAERGGLCSTEFHVVRVRPPKRPEDAVLSDYLATALRSSVVVAQTKHMMTGNTHPRLANADVVNLLVPVPSPQVQERVVSELSRRRVEARRLRAEATDEWEAARARFEREILGGRGLVP